jgi:hypothetical protein
MYRSVLFTGRIDSHKNQGGLVKGTGWLGLALVTAG